MIIDNKTTNSNNSTVITVMGGTTCLTLLV